jgi:hypothetical protein
MSAIKPLGEHCRWCHRLTHQGKCAAWFKAHPEELEFYKAAGRKASTRAARTRWNDQPIFRRQRVHKTKRWIAEAQQARDGLVDAFLAGRDTTEWTRKLNTLLSMNDKERKMEKEHVLRC